LFDAALTEMNYDLNKLPLGRLSKNTILQGFSALKVSTCDIHRVQMLTSPQKLADVLDNNTMSEAAKSAEYRRLTDAYYSGLWLLARRRIGLGLTGW
jgi:hypothetical protein